MKRILMVLSIAVLFGMALYANAYAGSTGDQTSQRNESMRTMAPFEAPGSTFAPSGGFAYYGSEPQGARLEGSQARNYDEGEGYRPWLTPGSTFASSGGFGSYGAEHATEIVSPERQMQASYGQAPKYEEAPFSNEEGAVHPFSTPGSTFAPSGGFGYY